MTAVVLLPATLTISGGLYSTRQPVVLVDPRSDSEERLHAFSGIVIDIILAWAGWRGSTLPSRSAAKGLREAGEGGVSGRSVAPPPPEPSAPPVKSGPAISDVAPPKQAFKGPAARHSAARVSQKTLTKELNTVIEPGIDVASDVKAINEGLAQKQGGNFIINDRTYGMHDGTLYPISGPGFHQLNRPSFKALGVLNQFGETPQAFEILKKMKTSDGDLAAASAVYRRLK
jgi:hypothetical protein